MKKTLTILLSILMLMSLVSCVNKSGSDVNVSSVTVNPTSQKISYDSSIINVVTAIPQNSNTSTTEDEHNIVTPSFRNENTNTSVSYANDENSAPQILFFTLEDITTLEKAFNSMTEEEFKKFIVEHPKHYEANGLNNRSDAERILCELKETTIISIDDNTENIAEMYFYLERNEIQQSILIEDEKRLVCTYYTPQAPKETDNLLKDSENIKMHEEMRVNDVVIEMYQIKDNNSYFAKLTVNNTTILCRTVNVETVEEFKSYFNRITFIKIGALLTE